MWLYCNAKGILPKNVGMKNGFADIRAGDDHNGNKIVSKKWFYQPHKLVQNKVEEEFNGYKQSRSNMNTVDSWKTPCS